MLAAAQSTSIMSRYTATTAAVTLPPIHHTKEPLSSSSSKQLLPGSSDNSTADPTTFLSSLHTHIQHSQSLHATLHHHTNSTLATLTARLTTSPHTRRPHTQPTQHSNTRQSIREAQQVDHQWRINAQERSVMQNNVTHRRQHTQRLAERRRDEESGRDKRIYQQQQHIFQLQLERLAQQSDAETTRETEEAADEQRQCDERRATVQSAVDGKKRAWEKLTGKSGREVEQQWVDEWTALITSDDESSLPSSLDSTTTISGDRLNAAIATTTPALASAASAATSTQQLTASSPRQPQPSPSAKKGGKKDDTTAPPPPPPPSLAALLTSHPAAFTTHTQCRQLAATFHTAPQLSPALAAFLTSVHTTPLFPSFLQHVHRAAVGPSLPCLPLCLPSFRHIVSVVGAPYSGKRTQSVRLARHLNCHVIDVHSLVSSPDAPDVVKKRLLSGSVIDDRLLVTLVCDEMARVDTTVWDGVLLLDFPTTLSQAHLLCSYLTGVLPTETEEQTATRARLTQPSIDALPVAAPVVPAGGGLTAVIELQCDARTTRSRCVGRCVDPTSGVEWHRQYNEIEWEQPGKEALTSVDDGATLEKAARDWQRQRSALSGWWQQCDNKLTVDGEGGRDDVTTRVSLALDALMARPTAETAVVESSVFDGSLCDLQLARMLSSHVTRYQAAYVEASELYVRSMRALRLSAEERNATIRESVTRVVNSENATLDVWRDEEEREETELTALDFDEVTSRCQDGNEKDEQHLRIDDMSARMCAALAARHSQWRVELSAAGSDGWVERMKRRLIAASVRQLQAELDRWVSEARVVRDYAAGSGAVLTEDERGEKRYELVWSKGGRVAAEDKKDDKTTAAAGKADKAKGAKAAAAASTEELKADVDVWTDMRQQLTNLLWQPQPAAADDASTEQSKQLMAAVDASLWQRVERVESAGKAALESVESDVSRLMSQLDELVRTRTAAEEEEMRAVCRYARRRVEAEEERCGQWLIRREEPRVLVVDGRRRMRPAKAEVVVSVWETQSKIDADYKLAKDNEVQEGRAMEIEAHKAQETEVETVAEAVTEAEVKAQVVT